MAQQNANIQSQPGLSRREKIAYGLGDISNGLAVSSVGFWLLIYLTDVAGLSAFLAGVAIMIGRAWDAVTDPVMGWITDHTRSRWGKRLPYLLFGAIPYALAYFSLWVVPEFASQNAIFVYVTLSLIVFNTCLTVVFVPYTSLTAAITSDYDERTSLTGFRMFCSQSAFLIGAAVPSFLVLWVVSGGGADFFEKIGLQSFFGSWGGTARQGYFIMALLFAVIMVCSIWSTFFGCKENNTDDDRIESKSKTPLHYARAIVTELKQNPPFRYAVLILLLTNCAATFIAVNLPYYLQYSVSVRDHQTKLITILFLMAIIMVPVWVKIARKFGKAESYRIAMLIYALVLCTLPFIRPDTAEYLYVIAVFAGIMHSAALMIPWAIVPDVVEFDELQTGERREGLFYGGTTFSYKLATAIAVFASGTVLSIIGYVPNQPQSAEVVAGLNNLVGPLPAILLLCGAILSTKYPLTSAKHKEILAQLEAKRSTSRE
ncbi:MAG: MFS transporter [Bdellovibrionales bacterium]|nr:MFS transporter [Bdellovibrionales bacterium]